MSNYYLQFYRHTLYTAGESEWIDIASLDIHPFLLETLADLGVIKIQDHKLPEEHLEKVYKIIRLRENLGVNIPGACVILELLDRLEEKEQEIRNLRRRNR